MWPGKWFGHPKFPSPLQPPNAAIGDNRCGQGNGLVILSFPPHCSHRMQPLDVSIYGPFKRYYNAACTDWMLSNPGRALTIYDIAALSGQAYYRAFIPANITAGFSKTGIYPVNREVFTDDLLLPSAPSDREEQDVRNMQEANDKATEPNIAPMPEHAGEPQPSTSTESSIPKSPEDVRPYPKSAPRNEKTAGQSKKEYYSNGHTRKRSGCISS